MALERFVRGALLWSLLLLLLPLPADAVTVLHARSSRRLPSRGQTLFVTPARARALVDHHAVKYGVPLHIARNLVQTESSWRQNAVSPVGARGLMQLMPGTARELGVNIYDTAQNVEGGMRYLGELYRRFGRWDLALAAYNTGPTRVANYGGVPPWTMRYVSRIIRRPAVVAPAATLESEITMARWALKAAAARLSALQIFALGIPHGVRPRGPVGQPDS